MEAPKRPLSNLPEEHPLVRRGNVSVLQIQTKNQSRKLGRGIKG